MAITVVGVGNAAGQSAGSATASTVSVTPTRHASSASGDRVYVTVAANNTSGTTPANWTALFKDTVIGSGAAAAGAGQRWLSVYYRDYDGSWSMPAFTLTSATNNDQTVGSITLRLDAGETWDTPTSSSAGSDFGTANTGFSATTGTLATTTDALLLVVACDNDNVTMTSGAVTGTNSLAVGTVTERVDGGSATGNDVSLVVHTTPVTTGASSAGTLTLTGTLSAASQGGVIFVQQTVTAAAGGGTVTYDATGAGSFTTAASTGQISWSHTSTGSDRCAIVAMSLALNGPGPGGYTRVVTYGGVTMTSLGTMEGGGAGAGGGFVELFYLLNQATGAQTVAVDTSQTSGVLIGNSVSYTNVASVGTAVTSFGTTGAPSVTVSSATGRRVVAAIVGANTLSGPTQTQRSLQNVNNFSAAGNLLVEDAAGSASTVMACGTLNDWWGAVGVSLTAVAGAAAAPLQPQQHLTAAVRRAGFY